MADNLRVLACQVNMDIAQFQASALVADKTIGESGLVTAINIGNVADIVRCANALQNLAEKLAAAVLNG